MSELDDFARTTVTPMLRPQEAIVAIGWMANGNARWRNEPQRYFAVGTTQRFIVIQSRQSFGYGTPKMENEGVTAFEYLSIGRAYSNRYAAMTDSLVLEHAGGKVDWSVPSPSIVGAKSVDGHVDFSQSYLPWICRHTAAGTLRTPEGIQAAAAEWWQRPALEAQNEAYLTGLGRATKSNRWVRWPLALALLCICLVPLGLALRDDAGKGIRSNRHAMEFAREVDAGGDAQFDLDDRLSFLRGKIAEHERKQMMGLALSAAGGLGAIGLFVLALRLTRKKRAALRTGAV